MSGVDEKKKLTPSNKIELYTLIGTLPAHISNLLNEMFTEDSNQSRAHTVVDIKHFCEDLEAQQEQTGSWIDLIANSPTIVQNIQYFYTLTDSKSDDVKTKLISLVQTILKEYEQHIDKITQANIAGQNNPFNEINSETLKSFFELSDFYASIGGENNRLINYAKQQKDTLLLSLFINPLNEPKGNSSPSELYAYLLNQMASNSKDFFNEKTTNEIIEMLKTGELTQQMTVLQNCDSSLLCSLLSHNIANQCFYKSKAEHLELKSAYHNLTSNSQFRELLAIAFAPQRFSNSGHIFTDEELDTIFSLTQAYTSPPISITKSLEDITKGKKETSNMVDTNVSLTLTDDIKFNLANRQFTKNGIQIVSLTECEKTYLEKFKGLIGKSIPIAQLYSEENNIRTVILGDYMLQTTIIDGQPNLALYYLDYLKGSEQNKYVPSVDESEEQFKFIQKVSKSGKFQILSPNDQNHNDIDLVLGLISNDSESLAILQDPVSKNGNFTVCDFNSLFKKPRDLFKATHSRTSTSIKDLRQRENKENPLTMDADTFNREYIDVDDDVLKNGLDIEGSYWSKVNPESKNVELVVVSQKTTRSDTTVTNKDLGKKKKKKNLKKIIQLK